MYATLQQRLQDVDRQQGVTLLYACESGSRGWGFPSPDSDYDVRFVYTRPLDAYLRVIESPDTPDAALAERLLVRMRTALYDRTA